MAEPVVVEVVYATPDQQRLCPVDVPEGASVAAAIAASGLIEEFGLDEETLEAGIWSHRVALDTRVKMGDRIEIYRPLKIDPKLARRQRAAAARGPRKGRSG
ncbi:MAG: RnfH family protein [Dokdonella sp.]